LVRSPELDLEVYQGPFDLLLSLIMKEEVDLLEVPLVEIITAYLEEMEAAGAVGYWDDMTEFLLLMSLLVEVKSRMLLPGAFVELEEEITPEEAREQLLGRLFTYSKFKAAADRLRQLGDASSTWLLRQPAGQCKVILPPLEEIADSEGASTLKESLLRLCARKDEPDSSHIVQVKLELRRQIGLVRDLVSREGRFSFNESFGEDEPLVQALTVFALLDLLSRGEIRVQQRKIFGDIVVERSQMQKSA
jgi:segregation and condensation protein A